MASWNWTGDEAWTEQTLFAFAQELTGGKGLAAFHSFFSPLFINVAFKLILFSVLPWNGARVEWVGRQSPIVGHAGRRHACLVTFQRCQGFHRSPRHSTGGGTPWVAGGVHRSPCLTTHGALCPGFCLVPQEPGDEVAMVISLGSQGDQAQRGQQIASKPRLVAELGPESGRPSFSPLRAPVFPGLALEAPPLTVLPVLISQACAFSAPSPFTSLHCLLPSFPFGMLPPGSVGSRCSIVCSCSSLLPDQHKCPILIARVLGIAVPLKQAHK